MPTETEKNRSIGLKKIMFGDVATGVTTMPATMAQLGRTAEGTAEFTTESPTIADFLCEEESEPVESVVTAAGLKNIKLEMLEWDNAALVSVFGGSILTASTVSVDGQTYGGVEKYVAPPSTVQIEKSVRAITAYNQVIDIPRAKISARFIWGLKKTEIAKIEIIARAMAPSSATSGPYAVYKLGAPVVSGGVPNGDGDAD